MPHSLFRNRGEAGALLSQRLLGYETRHDAIVLGLPRGGVPVAFQIAQNLAIDLDVFLVRKLGVPGNEELAMGAIASGGARVVNEEVTRRLDRADEVIAAAARREQEELIRQETLYRGGRELPQLAGSTVILVDDGVATGASVRAAIKALRQLQVGHIVLAIPVAAPDIYHQLLLEVDELVCLRVPVKFESVGEFYDDFEPTTDREVVELLNLSQTLAEPAPLRAAA